MLVEIQQPLDRKANSLFISPVVNKSYMLYYNPDRLIMLTSFKILEKEFKFYYMKLLGLFKCWWKFNNLWIEKQNYCL